MTASRSARHVQQVRRAALIGALVAASAGAGACGLVLGIDDVPAVKGLVDAGAHDAPSRDVHVADVKPDRSVEDGRPDRSVADAAPDVQVGLLPARGGTETPSDAEVNFAAHYLWAGETDKTAAFPPNPSAWATFGYNIDGKVTTASSTDVCTLAKNASPSVQIDGNLGADNSFGENLVGDISIAFGGDFSKQLTDKVENGDFTVLIDTSGLTSSPTQTNVGLTTRIFGGAKFPGEPTFTVADDWPVDPSTLADGRTLANGAKISFSDSYVTNGTWVSGQPTDIVFSLEISNEPLTLVFHQAVASFKHTTDDAGASHALSGMIAGILKADEFYGSIASVIGGISGGMYCDLLGDFQSKITSAQDIMEDGSNAPDETCNGISVAIAFEADQIQPPSVIAPPTLRDGAIPACPSDASN
jgi:hypothetical protein